MVMPVTSVGSRAELSSWLPSLSRLYFRRVYGDFGSLHTCPVSFFFFFSSFLLNYFEALGNLPVSSFTPERIKQEKKNVLSIEMKTFSSNIRNEFLNSEI